MWPSKVSGRVAPWGRLVKFPWMNAGPVLRSKVSGVPGVGEKARLTSSEPLTMGDSVVKGQSAGVVKVAGASGRIHWMEAGLVLTDPAS